MAMDPYDAVLTSPITAERIGEAHSTEPFSVRGQALNVVKRLVNEEIMMSADKSDPASEEFKSERTYLENLLASRINFFLVFASFYFVAVFGSDRIAPTHRAIALVLGGLVSLVMALSVLRTTALVEEVLCCFRAKHPNHPYSLAHNALKTRWWVSFSANACISLLPWGVTVAFFWLAFSAWRAP